MTYGAETWTLTEPLKQQLRRTQRRMIRIIIGTPRRRTAAPTPHNDPAADQNNTRHHSKGSTSSRDPNDSNDSNDSDVRSDPPNPLNLQDAGNDDEDTQPSSKGDDDLELWSDFVRRSTRRAESLMTMHDIPDVLFIHRRMVWRWANTLSHHPTTRWTRRVLEWNPNLNTRQRGRRQHGGQPKRWDDDIRSFLHSLDSEAVEEQNRAATQPRQYEHNNTNDIRWIRAAYCTEWWTSCEPAYVSQA